MHNFDRVSVSLECRQVFADGQPQHIGARAFEILELLIRAEGGLVTKDHIMRTVWPNTVVVENNLHVHISTLRKLFGGKHGWIRTEAGRGYRLAPPAENTRVPVVDAVPVQAHALTAQRKWSLIGREDELAELRNLFEREVLVTLVGPGGVGKSHLALEAAAALACSRRIKLCHVDLASVTGRDKLMGTLLRALRGSGDSCNVESDDVVREIGARKLVLVFDNCERCVDELAELCEAIAASNAAVSMIVTSREPLRVACERIYRVAPLAVPDTGASESDLEACSAVRVFIARAHAMGTDFPRDLKTLRMVASVCGRLNGLPLGLELAAARAASLGIKGLLADLDRSLLSLSGGLRTAHPRQRTLRASVEWSYELLGEAERTVLRRLAVFPSTFRLEAACELATCEQLGHDAVLDCVVSLASKSLLLVHAAGLSKYYSLLDCVRMYAFEKLEEAGERMQVSKRYLSSPGIDTLLTAPRRSSPMALTIAAPATVPYM
ncbi:winged helix-turn-helix domain-containing protein [Paraburkholderia sp. LEh10]|uniref:ATP-binding protein n=1 Tax=Paraburkholderia sp. LEh10 TaxID=2821353 RepID=UPI001AE6B843|nr:winged helix-turn-helix domain-containing protein [Paraburkholderia sp. LEh10]MBP0593005.1 winged helix-turn-helix domain-containing protein [Paraburkholderia sp. LEh10]